LEKIEAEIFWENSAENFRGKLKNREEKFWKIVDFFCGEKFERKFHRENF